MCRSSRRLTRRSSAATAVFVRLSRTGHDLRLTLSALRKNAEVPVRGQV
jgi:hypothetical protein